MFSNSKKGLFCLMVSAFALTISSAISASAAQAAAPAWRVIGVTGPTNLPPVQSEIQKVTVDAEGGTFALSFEGQTTGPLPFDAASGVVKVALDGLTTIGGVGGAVEVSGGPGDDGGKSPYFVRFIGSFKGSDVPLGTVDASLLTGGTPSGSVMTKLSGGTPGKGEIAVYVTNVGGASTDGTSVTVMIGPLLAGIAPSIRGALYGY